MSSEWYCKLKRACSAHAEAYQDMEHLLATIRQEGVYALGSSALRAASTTLLQEQGTPFSCSTRWLLSRLQQAGLSPSFPCYVGIDVLHTSTSTSVGSGQVARNTMRLIYDLLALLLEVPELQEHPHRAQLQRSVQKSMERCCEYTFARVPPESPSAEVVHMTLLPESSAADELIFLRVVQSTELVFHTAALLAERALETIAYSDVVEAMTALHWVVCLEGLLLPLLRLLAPMSVEHWLSFRPLIVRPSAIQSMSFHHLSTHLHELGRILNHPRYAKEQQMYLPCCQELLSQALRRLHTWYKAHTNIAAKYGQAAHDEKPEGVRWLETQQPFDVPAGSTGRRLMP